MKRNDYIDFIKGVAILLVLVGHAIQYCYGAEYFLQGAYFSNPIFKFIYTFHMPLFMAVSGYLLQQTLTHRTSDCRYGGSDQNENSFHIECFYAFFATD